MNAKSASRFAGGAFFTPALDIPDINEWWWRFLLISGIIRFHVTCCSFKTEKGRSLCISALLCMEKWRDVGDGLLILCGCGSNLYSGVVLSIVLCSEVIVIKFIKNGIIIWYNRKYQKKLKCVKEILKIMLLMKNIDIGLND